jgi:hypothetical protein
MDLKNKMVEYGLDLAQNRDKWQALVNTIMNLLVS